MELLQKKIIIFSTIQTVTMYCSEVLLLMFNITYNMKPLLRTQKWVSNGSLKVSAELQK